MFLSHPHKSHMSAPSLYTRISHNMASDVMAEALFRIETYDVAQ